MSTNDFRISITPATVQEWKNELSTIEENMKALEERRNVLRTRLHSVPFFLDEEKQGRLPGMHKKDTEPVRNAAELTLDEIMEDSKPIAEMNPAEAVRFILREAKTPLTKKEIKDRLRLAGYPMEKFGTTGAYFYTILLRFARTKKIRKDGERISLTE